MATIQDKINTIEDGADYVPNSLIIKSHDNKGCVLKWLESNQSGTGDRKERFVELDETEATTVLRLFNKTAVSDIDVNDPQ